MSDVKLTITEEHVLDQCEAAIAHAHATIPPDAIQAMLHAAIGGKSASEISEAGMHACPKGGG